MVGAHCLSWMLSDHVFILGFVGDTQCMGTCAGPVLPEGSWSFFKASCLLSLCDHIPGTLATLPWPEQCSWIVSVEVNVRTAMLGPDSLSPCLREITHPTPKIDKGTVVNFYLQVGAKDS
jgi:hypothetical protein